MISPLSLRSSRCVIGHATPRTVARVLRGPLLRGDGEQPMVLPDAGDTQVPERQTLLAEADLLEDADRGGVARDHGRLDAVERERPERGLDRLPDSFGREASPAD